MRVLFWMMGLAVLTLTACGDIQGTGGNGSAGFISVLPEGVVDIAAPFQDLTAVKIDPVDGCYVYRHTGPVETTFLPLRTAEGRPICSQEPQVPVTG